MTKVKGKLISVLIGIALLIVLAPLPANAGPYIGGYLKSDAVTSHRVLAKIDFLGTNAGKIPEGKWLGGVASVAGANGLAPSGWVYQSLVTLRHNNDVIWTPQAWEGNVLKWYHQEDGGEGDYVAFYERMDINNGAVLYLLYAYETSSDVINNTPTVIHSWYNLTDDANSLVGSQLHGGEWFKHFQFGVESNYAITNTAWEELNSDSCYYDGSNWRYVEGRVCWYPSSLITWIGEQNYCIGTANYWGVNKESSWADTVRWKYTGETITDDSLLWSQSGTKFPCPGAPYSTSAALSGKVSFLGRDTPPNEKWVEPFTLRFFQPGTKNEMPWSPVAVTTNQAGYFWIQTIPVGVYDIAIKNWTCLSELEKETEVYYTYTGTCYLDFGTTREGDANNDDWVTGADRNLLYAAWGSHEGDPNWNPHCDFNRDGWVTGADRNLMYTNWGQHGDLV